MLLEISLGFITDKSCCSSYTLLIQIQKGGIGAVFSLAILAQGSAVIIFILFIFLVIGLGAWGYIQAQKRREAMAKLARYWGLNFHADKDWDMQDRFPQFKCLRQGDDCYAYNIIHGRLHDRDVMAFDYHYETESRDSKGKRTTHNHYFSAMVVDAELPLKPLIIRPEEFFDRIGEWFGFDDIDFESSEFSRKFYVKSPDKKWAFDVIHQETMEFMLKSPTFTIEFGGGRVMAYRNDTLALREFQAALVVIEGILDRLPDYLLRELKGVDV